MCVCAYRVDDVNRNGDFNHARTDVCSIDLWLFCKHCSGAFGRDINPSIKATSPRGLPPYPICAYKSICQCVCLCGREYKGVPEVLVKPLQYSSIVLFVKWVIPLSKKKENVMNKQH